MFGQHKKKHHPDFVEPDLPITPMLDMTFQLLSFFIFTFHPQSKEQMIFVTLPDQSGGGAGIPDPSETKPVVLVFEVQAGDNHGLGAMQLRIEDKEATAGGKSRVAVNDLNHYRTLLADKKREYEAAKRQVKVQLEVAPTLAWRNTVLLIDSAKNAGYTDVAPTILGAK